MPGAGPYLRKIVVGVAAAIGEELGTTPPDTLTVRCRSGCAAPLSAVGEGEAMVTVRLRWRVAVGVAATFALATEVPA